LRQLGLSYQSKSETSNSDSLLIKALLHNFQIVSVLRFNEALALVKIPRFIDFVPSLVGDPIKNI
jgi:hypothetical protein